MLLGNTLSGSSLPLGELGVVASELPHDAWRGGHGGQLRPGALDQAHLEPVLHQGPTQEALVERFLARHTAAAMAEWVEQVAAREVDLYAAVQQLLSQ